MNNTYVFQIFLYHISMTYWYFVNDVLSQIFKMHSKDFLMAKEMFNCNKLYFPVYSQTQFIGPSSHYFDLIIGYQASKVATLLQYTYQNITGGFFLSSWKGTNLTFEKLEICLQPLYFTLETSSLVFQKKLQAVLAQPG